MDDRYLMSSLYINKISISKKIPQRNYLNDLPVVKNLKEMDGIRLLYQVMAEFHCIINLMVRVLCHWWKIASPEMDYKNTEHFMITKRFMDAPEEMIKRLLD